MGTLFTMSVYSPDQPTAESAAGEAFRRIDGLEEVMSDYQADSELMTLCDQPAGKPVAVSADLFDVIQRSCKFSEISEGAFDITVGPYVRLWRFSRKRKVLPAPADIEKARATVGWRKLRLDAKAKTVTLLVPGMRLDLGGIAKGYAADQALKVLKGRGLSRALVAASGDIALGEPPPGQPGWRVGVAGTGQGTNSVGKTLVLRNAAVSTSGDAEQYIDIDGVRYSHIVSPATGLGLTERVQATIVAPNATTTDAMATTVSVLGLSRGMRLVESMPNVDALMVTGTGADKRILESRHFSKFER